MKGLLMFKDRDLKKPEKSNYTEKTVCRDPRDQALCDDLELEPILSAMADGDSLIKKVCLQVLLSPLTKPAQIRYRQEIMKDALAHPQAVRALYDLCIDTENRRKDVWFSLRSYRLTSTFSTAKDLLSIYLDSLQELRKIADQNRKDFVSPGFCRFFDMVEKELSDEYFARVLPLKNRLSSAGGLLISAKFGPYLQGVSYVFRQKKTRHSRLQWLFAPSYTIADRDDAGANDLNIRQDRAINEATNALAQSAEHLEQFFALLRRELAFYVGAIRLRDRVEALGLPVCIPEVLEKTEERRSWDNLYDISLALVKGGPVTGNRGSAENQNLIIITGANQGGKTTFLRSVGQAQLMAQCGLFVAAEHLTVPVRGQVFTHFKREEDREMERGKLEEELSRMSAIADRLREHDLILFNESFSSTNEREGSQVFGEITAALLEGRVEIFSVTHLYAYAARFAEDERAAFLRAQRLPDGSRTFRLLPGKPLETAYGEDLYRKVFRE